MKNNSNLENILRVLKSTKIEFLILAPLLLALVFFFGSSMLAFSYFSEEAKFAPIRSMLLSFMLFIGGFGGVFQIWRKESWFSGIRISGVPAIISGVLQLIVFWVPGVIFLFHGFRQLLFK